MLTTASAAAMSWKLSAFDITRHVAVARVCSTAVVQVLQRVVHSQLTPLPLNPTDVVHTVAQAEHELRAGALRLEGVQTVAKLTLGTARLVIDQDQVRGESQGGGAQDLAADGPEALLGP